MQNRKSKITAIRQTIVFRYKYKWYTVGSCRVADRTICNIPVIKHNQGGYEEECICVGVTESFCCISESNTMLQTKPTSKTEHTAVGTKCSRSPSPHIDLTLALSLPSPSFLTGNQMLKPCEPRHTDRKVFTPCPFFPGQFPKCTWTQSVLSSVTSPYFS